MVGTELAMLFTPELCSVVSSLTLDGRIGICQGLPRIDSASSGYASSSSQKENILDRFSIVVPYAGCSITLEILFNGQHPDAPPDFIFPAKEAGFAPDISNIKSLIDWNPSNNHALLTVVDEVLAEYKKYHMTLLRQHSRLIFEYESLIQEYNLNDADIEVHIAKKGEYRVGPINFLIKLPVDFSRIPLYLTKDHPGEDTGVLLVTFQAPESSKVTPQLYLSPRIEHVLGGVSSMRIPSYPVGGCLLDYVPSVCELLTNKVDQVSEGYELRRKYVSTFLSMFGKSVVEYDAEAFTHVTFLFEWNDFFFNVNIQLSKQFPAKCPIVSLMSIYHEDDSAKPYMNVYENYPYSPRWKPHEMANRLRKYITDHVAEFQKESVTEGTF